MLKKCWIVLHIPKPGNYKRKSQGNNKKNKTLPFLVPMSKPAILHLISCSDDFQSMKLDQIKSHAFLQHSTLSLTQQVFFFITLVWCSSEQSWKMVKFTFGTSGVFTLSDLTEKVKFFCSSIFPFPVLFCSHYSFSNNSYPFLFPYSTTCMLQWYGSKLGHPLYANKSRQDFFPSKYEIILTLLLHNSLKSF